MTWSAALPGATARALRAVVGRRALQVGLLVGGLFVLGFLCGEQAHAADGIGALPGRAVGQPLKPPAVGQPVKPPVVGQPVKPPAVLQAPHAGAATGTNTDRDANADTAKDSTSVPGTAAPTRPAVGKAHCPVTEDVIGAVANNVVQPVGDLVQPVGDLVQTVTTGLTETVGIPAEPTLPGWPTLPSFPESPSWPALPTVPGVPTVPGLPGTPGQTLPAPAPVTSAPQPQPQTQPGDHAVEKPAGDKGAAADSAVYGPRFAGHGTVTEPVTCPSAHCATATTTTAHTPAHRAPSDNPGGTLGGKSAVDNGSSRHGDAHAVTPDHRAPLRLVPGAAASVDAAGTRDRHRDIPVFPG